MRAVNLAALTLGKFREWHLVTPNVMPRYLTLNFFPFLVDKYVSTGVADKLQLLWCVGVALSLIAAVRLAWSWLGFDGRPRAGGHSGKRSGGVI